MQQFTTEYIIIACYKNYKNESCLNTVWRIQIVKLSLRTSIFMFMLKALPRSSYQVFLDTIVNGQGMYFYLPEPTLYSAATAEFSTSRTHKCLNT